MLLGDSLFPIRRKKKKKKRLKSSGAALNHKAQDALFGFAVEFLQQNVLLPWPQASRSHSLTEHSPLVDGIFCSLNVFMVFLCIHIKIFNCCLILMQLSESGKKLAFNLFFFLSPHQLQSCSYK